MSSLISNKLISNKKSITDRVDNSNIIVEINVANLESGTESYYSGSWIRLGQIEANF